MNLPDPRTVLPHAETLLKGMVEFRATIDQLRIYLDEVKQSGINHDKAVICAELRDVTTTTEEATIIVMSSCEAILKRLQNAEPSVYHDVELEIIRIYEACTLQDMKGQKLQAFTEKLDELRRKAETLAITLYGQLGLEDHKPQEQAVIDQYLTTLEKTNHAQMSDCG